MTRRPRAAPTRAGRRAVLARAAGLAAAGLAIDPAGTGRLLAAVQRAAPAVDWLWSGAITPGSARDPGPRHRRRPGAAARDARRRPRRRPRRRIVHADRAAVDRRRPHLRRRRPAARHRLPLRGRDRRRPRRAHRPVPHLRRRAVTRSRSPSARARRPDRTTWSSTPSAGAAPHFFLHLGDFHYANIGVDDPWRFREASNRVLRSPRQSALYREAPIVYVFDDHDFGTDDSDGTSVTKAAVQRVYRERVPHYPLPLSAVPPDARARHRPARAHRPGVHRRPGPHHRHRHPLGADAAARAATPPPARCSARRSGSGSSTS